MIKTNMVLISLSREALQTHLATAIEGGKWKARTPYKKIGGLYVQNLDRVLIPSSFWTKLKALFKSNVKVMYIDEDLKR